MMDNLPKLIHLNLLLPMLNQLFDFQYIVPFHLKIRQIIITHSHKVLLISGIC